MRQKTTRFPVALTSTGPASERSMGEKFPLGDVLSKKYSCEFYLLREFFTNTLDRDRMHCNVFGSSCSRLSDTVFYQIKQLRIFEVCEMPNNFLHSYESGPVSTTTTRYTVLFCRYENKLEHCWESYLLCRAT